jgi:putative flippase GtrA
LHVPHWVSFTRNTLTSVFTTALDFGVLVALVELLHIDYRVATFVGTVVGAGSNFLINRWWSFRVHDLAPHGQIMRFLPVQAGSSCLQTLGVWGLTELTPLRYWTTKLVVSAAVYLLWNYPMNRWFVFTRAAPAAARPPVA